MAHENLSNSGQTAKGLVRDPRQLDLFDQYDRKNKPPKPSAPRRVAPPTSPLREAGTFMRDFVKTLER